MNVTDRTGTKGVLLLESDNELFISMYSASLDTLKVSSGVSFMAHNNPQTLQHGKH